MNIRLTGQSLSASVRIKLEQSNATCAQQKQLAF